MSYPIVAPDVPETLRRWPDTWARRCVQCRSYRGTRSGGLPTWIVDGLCPRCFIAARLNSRKGLPNTVTYSFIPDSLASEPGATLVMYRVLIDLQRRGAAAGWSTPTSAREIGESLAINERTAKRAISWLLSHNYLERQYVSGPRGGRRRVFRVVLEPERDA